MRQPQIPNSTVIDLLAAGNTVRQIAAMHGFKVFSLQRQIDRLKVKHDCKTITQLVVYFKLIELSELSNTEEQTE